jgi:hypothetical protein
LENTGDPVNVVKNHELARMASKRGLWITEPNTILFRFLIVHPWRALPIQSDVCKLRSYGSRDEGIFVVRMVVGSDSSVSA